MTRMNVSPARLLSRQYATAQKKMTMKQLVKQYGWVATGVYTVLCFVDFPLSYLFVHSLGEERLIDYEVAIRKKINADPSRESTFIHRSSSGGKSLLWTELGIAYVIHKCLVVVRAPLTVLITPGVARKLDTSGISKLWKKGIASSQTAKSANTIDPKRFGKPSSEGKKWFWFF